MEARVVGLAQIPEDHAPGPITAIQEICGNYKQRQNLQIDGEQNIPAESGPHTPKRIPSQDQKSTKRRMPRMWASEGNAATLRHGVPSVRKGEEEDVAKEQESQGNIHEDPYGGEKAI